MAAPAYTETKQSQETNSSPGGAVEHHDAEDWKHRFNAVLSRPKEHVMSSSPETAQPWRNSLFGCGPINLCLVTYFLPCVTFGKTHHRLRKNGNMEGYDSINASVSGITK
jgi:hypothetical protein